MSGLVSKLITFIVLLAGVWFCQISIYQSVPIKDGVKDGWVSTSILRVETSKRSKDLRESIRNLRMREKRSNDNLQDFYDFLVGKSLNRLCKLFRKAQLDETLTSVGTFTIFAPTDDAFAFLEGNLLEELENDTAKLQGFIMYHLAPGALTSVDLIDDSVVNSAQGAPLRFNVYENGNVLTVSGSQITTPDLKTGEILVHIIDHVLYPPPTNNLPNEIRSNYNTMYRLLEEAELAEILSDKSFTCFVPSDQAFRILPPSIRNALYTNATLLQRVLLNHIIPGAFFRAGLPVGFSLQPLDGNPLIFTTKRGLILVNGIPIVLPDIIVTNGVMHVINRVLLPPDVLEDCKCISPTVMATTTAKPILETEEQGSPIDEKYKDRYYPELETTPKAQINENLQTKPPIIPTIPPETTKDKPQCDGYDCPEEPTKQNCPEGNCPEEPTKQDCQGENCPEEPSKQNCQGENCPEEPTKQDCQGENCPEEPTKQNCQGENCPEEPSKQNCQGENCPEEPSKQNCQGENCPEEPSNQNCQGENCPEEPSKQNCQGENCPEEPNKQDCQGENCPEEPSKQDCQGENCPEEPTKQDCREENCPQEPSKQDCREKNCPVEPTRLDCSGTKCQEEPKPRCFENDCLDESKPDCPGENCELDTYKPVTKVNPECLGDDCPTLAPQDEIITKKPSDFEIRPLKIEDPQSTLPTTVTPIFQPATIEMIKVASVKTKGPFDLFDEVTPASEFDSTTSSQESSPAPEEIRDKTVETALDEITKPSNDRTTDKTKEPSDEWTTENPDNNVTEPSDEKTSNASLDKFTEPSDEKSTASPDKTTEPSDENSTVSPDKTTKPIDERTTVSPYKTTETSYEKPTAIPDKTTESSDEKTTAIPDKTTESSDEKTIASLDKTTESSDEKTTASPDKTTEPSVEKTIEQSEEKTTVSPDKTTEPSDEKTTEPSENKTTIQSDKKTSASPDKTTEPTDEKTTEPSENNTTKQSDDKTTVSPDKTTEPSDEKTTEPSENKTTIQSDEKTSASPDKTTEPSEKKTTKLSDENTTLSTDKTTEVSNEKTTEPSENKTTEPSENKATEQSDDKTTVSPDKTTDPSDEKTSEPSEKKTTKLSDENTTLSPDKTTEVSNEKTTEPSNEKTTEQSDEKTTEQSDEKTTASPDKTTEPSDEKTTVSADKTKPSDEKTTVSADKTKPSDEKTTEPSDEKTTVSPDKTTETSDEKTSKPDIEKSTENTLKVTERPEKNTDVIPETSTKKSDQSQNKEQTTTSRVEYVTSITKTISSSSKPLSQKETEYELITPETTTESYENPTITDVTEKPPIPQIPELSCSNGSNKPPKSVEDFLNQPGLVLNQKPVTFKVVLNLFNTAGLTPILRRRVPYTLCVPTDEAFSALSNENIAKLKADMKKLRKLLLFHVIASQLPNYSLRDNTLIKTYQGSPVIINVQNGGKQVLIGGSRVIGSRKTPFGQIYVLNKPLTKVPRESVLIALRDRPNVSRFYHFVQGCPLSKTLQGKGPYTIMAPTNDAFSQLPQETLNKIRIDKRALERLLNNHVVSGARYVQSVNQNKLVSTIQNGKLRFTRSRDQVLINGARIMESDISTGNGVVHVVNKVLVPDNDRQLINTAPATKRNPVLDRLSRGLGVDKFVNFLIQSGVMSKLEDGGSYTIFAPTDTAIESLPPTLLRNIEHNPNQMLPIVKYHIIPSPVQFHQIRDETTLPTLLPNKEIRFNYYHNGTVITVSGAPIGPVRTMDRLTLCVVNKVLYPPIGDIAKTVAKSPILQDLTKALKITGLDEELGEMAGPYTLFAPTEAAFRNLPKAEFLSLFNDPDKLRDLISRHLLRGTLFSAGVSDHMTTRTINGGEMTLTLRPQCIVVNGVNVIYSDITATNGVVHVLDHLL